MKPMFEETEISAQAEAGAIVPVQASPRLPRQQLTKASHASKPTCVTPSSTKSRKGGKAIHRSEPIVFEPSRHIPQASTRVITPTRLPAEPELCGLAAGVTQVHGAAQCPSDCGPISVATQTSASAVGEITAVYRRYEDLRRARQRIELQAIATCRTVCGGDKIEGMKLYKSPTPQVEVWLTPYRLAMEPLESAIKEQKKLLTKLGKALPVREWADSVPGLSPRFLAAIVGECGIGPGEFKSVSALWKRMGMAVINGGRQRRVTGDAALEHGYVARRRSLMWNIGDQVAVRQGIRNPKDEDGKPTGAVAINEWGALYLERKTYELAREIEGKPLSPMHAHNRAKRYVEKRLLRSLWQEWRRARAKSKTIPPPPAA